MEAAKEESTPVTPLEEPFPDLEEEEEEEETEEETEEREEEQETEVRVATTPPLRRVVTKKPVEREEKGKGNTVVSLAMVVGGAWAVVQGLRQL